MTRKYWDGKSGTAGRGSDRAGFRRRLLLRAASMGITLPGMILSGFALFGILGVGVGSLAVAAPAQARESLPDPDQEGLTAGERLSALLERVQAEQAAMKTLEARFSMLQEDELLLEPEESTGAFVYAAPDQVRWDYEEPRALTVLVQKDEMTTWYRDLGRAEVAQVGKYSDRFLKFMNATGSLASLLESFDARVRFGDGSEEPYHIELSPKYKRIAKRVRSMTLRIDRDRYVPVLVRIEGADGSVTEFRFEDIRINGEIPAERFRLELPPETEVQEIQLGGGSS